MSTTVTGQRRRSGGFLSSLFPRPRFLPLRLFLEQFRFRDGENLADGVVKPFCFCTTGHVWCWQGFIHMLITASCGHYNATNSVREISLAFPMYKTGDSSQNK